MQDETSGVCKANVCAATLVSSSSSPSRSRCAAYVVYIDKPTRQTTVPQHNASRWPERGECDEKATQVRTAGRSGSARDQHALRPRFVNEARRAGSIDCLRFELGHCRYSSCMQQTVDSRPAEHATLDDHAQAVKKSRRLSKYEHTGPNDYYAVIHSG